MQTFPLVTVIVPVLNEAGFIEKALNSIRNGRYPAEKLEILVVDGMSNDGTRDIVKRMAQEDPRIILLDNPKKIQAPAMNIGIRAAKGDIIIRVDGHAEVVEDFVLKHVEVMDAHPEAWCVGGHITTCGKGFMGRAIAAAMCSPVGAGDAKYRLGNYEGYVDTILFGSYRKWAFDKFGLFDEQLVVNEDDELNLRLHLAGGKIYMSSLIHSTYYSRASLSKLWHQYFQYGFWRPRTIQKHKRPATLRQLIPSLFVTSVFGLFLLGWLWAGFWWLLLFEALLYTAGLLYGSMNVYQSAGLKYALVAPIIFPILHFSYGLGCLWGIVRFIIFKGAGLPKPEEFKLSR